MVCFLTNKDVYLEKINEIWDRTLVNQRKYQNYLKKDRKYKRIH